MQELILTFMEEYGTLAVFLLIFIENIFPPIPSEVILTFGGVMTTVTDITALSVIFSATAGSVAGAMVLYLTGYLITDRMLERILSGFAGRALGFSAEDVRSAQEWFLKKGDMAVFFCRLVPIVRSLISIPAGLSRMPMAPFFLLTAAGSLIWNAALVYAGRAAGASWEKFSKALGAWSDLFLIALGLGTLLFLFLHNRKKAGAASVKTSPDS